MRDPVGLPPAIESHALSVHSADWSASRTDQEEHLLGKAWRLSESNAAWSV